ncbi:MAG: hypothetical protein WAW52_04840 [Methanothrix sp.]
MQSDLRESSEFSEYEDGFGMPKILVVGCGGAGNNTVSRLARMGLAGAKTVAVNTDSQHLKTAQADERILIGQNLTRGMGAGGDPEVGRKAAELAAAELESMLRGADLVFVIAGLGGGTGTGSAPVVARLAKERGAIVVAMVTPRPFTWRGRASLWLRRGWSSFAATQTHQLSWTTTASWNAHPTCLSSTPFPW